MDSSILAVDFGNIQTRAVLIDLVEGVYRVVARAETRTTGAFPISDVGVGFWRIIQQLSDTTGRRFATPEGTFITPEQPDRSGVDSFVATASIGRPLRTVLIGLMPDMSIASALRAAAGTYVDIVDVISLDDLRSPEAQLNLIVLARPDLIFITGGTEGGANEPVLQMARLARLAARLMDTSTSILYAGNSELVPEITALFEGVATLFVAENVRPALDGEALTAAQDQLARAFDSFTGQRGLGFEEVGYVSRVGIMPTAQSYHTVISYLGKTAANGVLAVDTGSATGTMSAAVRGSTTTSIRTDIGLGHSARDLIDAVGIDAVRKWLPFYASDDAILAYALNKTLRPATIPETQRELYFEHALLRAAISELLNATRPSWAEAQALTSKHEPLPYFERIIGGGAALTNTGQPGMTAMLLLDALQPSGVVHMQSDANALIPALGALARVNPEAVVQVLDAGGLENLCTCVCVSGMPRKGRPAVEVSITSPQTNQTERYTVQGGELWVYPLSYGLGARVRVSIKGRGLSVGGRSSLKLDIEGGTSGLVIDARGRPLPLETNLKQRAVQIPEWYAQVTGGDVFEIPQAWLSAPTVEPEITSVTDRRQAQTDRVLSVLGEAEDEPELVRRESVFGRQVRDVEDGE